MNFDIQLNESGTRHLTLSEEHLKTLRQYHLLESLTDSTGFVNEETLDRLKFQIRALIDSGHCEDSLLVNLCSEVIYHDKMKAYGLRNLIAKYQEYYSNCADTDEEQPSDEDTL